MFSRQSSTASSNDQRKPPRKAKPAALAGSPIFPTDEEDDLYSDSMTEKEDSPPPAYKLPERTRTQATRRLTTHRLVVGVDYGTTYTGVGYATPGISQRGGPGMDIKEISIVSTWGDRMANQDKVPSVISYSDAENREEQWGSDLSSKSVAMLNTKLELDVQDNKSDELELILQALDGMGNLDFYKVQEAQGLPDFTWKGPEDVATDYLSKVFKVIERELDELDPDLKDTTSVDIVVTVPVEWSYRAKNSTFRAICNAGFNKANFLKLQDVIMITEPEAAAIYTARVLQEELGEQFLRMEECFVLVDAGGGTVDVVSYRVVQLEPTLELQKVGYATSAKCGSTYIDRNFKRWLRWLIGDENYKILDPNFRGRKINAHTSEGELMRKVMKQFDVQKRKFGGGAAGRNMTIDLPPQLHHVQIPRKLEDGELIIPHGLMRKFFEPCVNRIIELVKGQISQIDKERRKLRNVLMVGGFAESKYLQDAVKASMRLRDIQLRRHDKSWSAVVRGAVLCGAEKNHHRRLRYMYQCPKNLGIVLNERKQSSRQDPRFTSAVTNREMAQILTWPILKGDLILSDEPRVADREIHMEFRENDPRKFAFKVYEYDYDDRVPTTFKYSNDLTTVFTLNVDFSQIPIDEFDRFSNSGRPYYVASSVCRLTVSRTTITAAIIWNGNVMASQQKDIDKKPRGLSASSSQANYYPASSSSQYGTPDITQDQPVSAIPRTFKSSYRDRSNASPSVQSQTRRRSPLQSPPHEATNLKWPSEPDFQASRSLYPLENQPTSHHKTPSIESYRPGDDFSITSVEADPVKLRKEYGGGDIETTAPSSSGSRRKRVSEPPNTQHRSVSDGILASHAPPPGPGYPGQYQPYRPVPHSTVPAFVQRRSRSEQQQPQHQATTTSGDSSFGRMSDAIPPSEYQEMPTSTTPKRRTSDHWAARLASEVSNDSGRRYA